MSNKQLQYNGKAYQIKQDMEELQWQTNEYVKNKLKKF